ncbi:NAD-dependent epimerase/dehydratase family protein [Sutcliffiella horikoshii]|uniref:NAD-dependent epimerase/dehydratase family protein n=1 Tax=Sutcliffiella horikoshii TaxID=79883 RepID=UPI001CFCDEA3|nr:NAD(P)-dependent oxidoreductase [Sutcliffiella horikoshii]
MKKLLITGANGFIGKHILEKLRNKDYEVHAITSRDISAIPTGDKVIWHNVDLLNSNKMEEIMKNIKPSILLHLAWIVTPENYKESIMNIEWILASMKLLRLFNKYGGKKVVISGTCAEYDTSTFVCIENSTPLKPSTLYAKSKCALRTIAEEYCKKENISLVWGRVFYVYGPEENINRLVPYVTSSLLNNKIANCTHGLQVLDYLYVKDVAEAFIAILENNITGEVNIGSGKPILLKDLIYQIGYQLNKPHLIKLSNKFPDKPHENIIVADIYKIQESTGWHPTTTLDEGLDHTIRWWKEQVNGGM